MSEFDHEVNNSFLPPPIPQYIYILAAMAHPAGGRFRVAARKDQIFPFVVSPGHPLGPIEGRGGI